MPGLTPSANNSAESLLAAIALKGQAGLTQVTFDTNIDQSLYLENGFSSFTTRGEAGVSYRVDQVTINLAKVDSGATLDPDDY
ncbi:hypothetical protein [Anabaena sp. PCC 7108]|uniref:hypothetical protein n=1 Tax=Anabaena sp. PCC 7108 TaxID=163908 RepID=UPI00350FBF80